MSQTYPVPADFSQCEIEIKKSRFIARAISVTCREEAMAFLRQAKEEYPDARHHCWAYLIGNPATNCSAAMNDDGEPGGTAGRPILNVIQHKGVGDVMVVVIRYFGGIKLGAGGLTRAYSGAAEALFSIMNIEQQQPMTRIRLRFDFAREQLIRHWAAEHAAEVGEVCYSQHVELTLTLPEEHKDELLEFANAHGINCD